MFEQRAQQKRAGAAASSDNAPSGPPMFTTNSSEVQLRNAGIATLAILTLVCWFAAHITFGEANQLAMAGVAIALAGVASGICLGLISPVAAVLISVAMVPFRGGSEALPFGFTEFLRGSALWGAVIRLLWDRFNAHRSRANYVPPSRMMTIAAVIGLLIAPLQRYTATSLGTFTAQGEFVDALGILGTQSLFFGAWLAAAHFPRTSIPKLQKAIGITIAVALALSFAAWLPPSMFNFFHPLKSLVKAVPFDFFLFNADVFGRLGTLGFPTPTAMGIAIAAPLAASAAFERSRISGVALLVAATVAIILTESRGPLIALAVMAVSVVPSIGLVRGRYLLALGGAGTLAGLLLFLNRYGSRLDLIFSGSLPNIGSDLQRITSWRAGIETAIAHPLTGGGWFSLRYWNDGELGKENVNLSHNIILQGLSDGGFPLGAASAIVVIGATVLLLRNWKSVPLAWRAAAIAVLVCGLWDMPQFRAFGSLFAGLALGLVSRRDGSTPTQE